MTTQRKAPVIATGPAVTAMGAAPIAVMAGAALLLTGAALVDTGFRLAQPALEQAGNVAMVLAGVGLALLPQALRATTRAGRWLYWAGLLLASLVDVPAVFDPTDMRAGQALGVPAMLLLSAGFIVLWRNRRQPLLLVAGLWFFVQFGPNLALFIVPDGRPLFVLQVAGPAIATALSVRGTRTAAAPRPDQTTSPAHT